jgi:secondary thiamine-phosphate synthase enzyme
MITLEVQTTQKREIADVTDLINAELKGSGMANVLVQHTTAALTLADLDPGTDVDYLKAIETLTPNIKWSHPHDPAHFPDHLWSSLIGQSVTLPFEDGKTLLGTWQRIILIELDGPRTRRLALHTIIT